MSRRKTALSRFNANERLRTLKRLRENAAPKDKALPELTATVPAYNEHGPRSTYSRITYWAETLEDLATRCGEHAEAAVAYARNGAIRSWLMKLYPDCSPLTHDYRLATEAIRLVGDEQLYRLGCPTTDGAMRKPVFDGLTPDYRCELVRAAIATNDDFDRAGSPGLSGLALAKRCKDTQQFIVAVDAMAKANAASPITLESIT